MSRAEIARSLAGWVGHGRPDYGLDPTTLLLSHSFLGYVDKLGVAYEAPTVATGFGAYLAQVGPSPVTNHWLCLCTWFQ